MLVMNGHLSTMLNVLNQDDKIVLTSIEEFETLLERVQLDNLFGHVIDATHALASLTEDFFVVMKW